MSWIVSLQNPYVEVLTPNILEYDLSRGAGFCRGNQVKMRSLGGHWVSMIGILLKRGNLETDTRTGGTACEDEGGARGDGSTSQGAPEIGNRPPRS